MKTNNSSGESKREWKSRFMEFFMLFLAVFLGFLSEYKLEHVLERELEEEYLKSYVEDVHADISMLEETILFVEQLSRGQDSLQQLLLNADKLIPEVGRIYSLSFTYDRWVIPEFNDQTISEMRNSGKLVLIEDDLVLDALLHYYKKMDVILKNTDKFVDWTTDLKEFSTRIFNSKYVQFEKAKSHTSFSQVSVDPDAELMTTDPFEIIVYGNHISRLRELSDDYILGYLEEQLILAKNLEGLINSKYDLY